MQESPMQQLLDDAQREVVADVVNAALLASASGKPKWEVKPQASFYPTLIPFTISAPSLSTLTILTLSPDTAFAFTSSPPPPFLLSLPPCAPILAAEGEGT